MGLKCLAAETAGCVALCRNKAGQLRGGPKGGFLQVCNSLRDKNISSALSFLLLGRVFLFVLFLKKHSLGVCSKSGGVLRTGVCKLNLKPVKCLRHVCFYVVFNFF